MSKVITKTVTPKYSSQEFDIEVVKGESIKIECFYTNSHTPKNWKSEFKVGDKCEYDSWNLRYLGTIVQITENSVLVDTECGKTSPKKRMKIGDFCNRNYKFDLAEINAYNAEESMYI